MNLQYVLNKRTNGANPFTIFEALKLLDEGALYTAIKRMPYACFMESAYWFAVSTVVKTEAGMRCQVCNSPTEIQAHHRTYDSHGREHLTLRDLVVLCSNCHGLFHGHKDVLPEFKRQKLRIRMDKKVLIPHRDEDLGLPPDAEIVLTKDLINNCRANGSFTNATLRAFGIKRSTMTSGWPGRLIGKVLTRDQYKKAAEGKFHYNSGRLE